MTQRLADAALRVIVAGGVDHAIAGFEGAQHGFDGVVPELIGAEPELRHPAPRVQGNREFRDVLNRGAQCVVCC